MSKYVKKGTWKWENEFTLSPLGEFTGCSRSLYFTLLMQLHPVQKCKFFVSPSRYKLYFQSSGITNLTTYTTDISKLGHFFPIFKKRQENPPPPPLEMRLDFPNNGTVILYRTLTNMNSSHAWNSKTSFCVKIGIMMRPCK